ncbi:bifunctional DNA primase/polymerase [Mesorhizobium sp. AaZ16]|uniref:bifunctional DNA primase/polymerase n=1 Tax=Mesorhizobium sp. AaZ16 TaxID=3402289 RepID=UPI00374E6F43
MATSIRRAWYSPPFPERDKRPAVKGYLKIGDRTSEQLALKFANDNAFGFACKRSQITVLDVDAPDERLLADALDQHGPSPLIIRSGSGNFQAWYRNNGEGRRVRPDPAKPIDILGDGFVVAPPSQGSKGQYQIIAGTLDDIERLPTMRRPCTRNVHNITKHPSPSPPSTGPSIPEGKRDAACFSGSCGRFVAATTSTNSWAQQGQST